MKKRSLVSGFVILIGSVYIGYKLYTKIVSSHSHPDWTSNILIGAAALIGFALGVLMILDFFDASPIKKQPSETYKVIDGDLEQEFQYPAPPGADFTNVFKTKVGFCYVLPDKIVLITNEAEMNPEKKVIERDIRPVLAIFSLIGLFLIGISINSFSKGVVYPSLLYGGLGIYILIKMIRSINNSATPIIPRSKITDIKYNKAIPFLTRNYFSIQYINQSGQSKKRLIMLPGILSGGSEEIKKALEIMRSENLLKQEE